MISFLLRMLTRVEVVVLFEPYISLGYGGLVVPEVEGG